jgi:hypothetical protein
VKLINKTLAFLSLVSLGFSSLDAKAIEFLLDQTVKGKFNVQDDIPEQNQEIPVNQLSLSQYFQQLKIENLGNTPILNCFPYANQAPTLSLEDLARKVSSKRYPVLALYQLWNQSITCDEAVADKPCHPLDLMNFKGVSSPTAFNEQFLKLCNALGIETRLANVQGKQVYDFGLDDEWNFFDLTNNQLYLGLDNEKLASLRRSWMIPSLLCAQSMAVKLNKWTLKKPGSSWLHLIFLNPFQQWILYKPQKI